MSPRLKALLRVLGLPGTLFLFGAASAAFAATTTKDGPSEAVFIVQLLLLVALGRLLGEGLQRIGQPAVMGQLAAGLVLGPSILGAIAPGFEAAAFPPSGPQTAMIEGMAAFGVLMLLLLSGMETDLRLVRRIGRPAVAISAGGIVVPFALGVAVALYLPAEILPQSQSRLITALFLGTALSISSVKVVAMVVRDLKFQRRDVGQILLATAILDDTIAWIVLGIISSFAATGVISLGSAARSGIGTVLFLAISFTVGRRLVFWLIRFANDNFIGEAMVISTILVLLAVMALTTNAIGVHTVLGAFVTGILVGNSPILARRINDQLKALTTALFMPVFFGLSGIHADLRVLADPATLALTVGLIVIASLGKFAGACFGGLAVGMKFRECVALGCGLNARGSTEVIVASIGLSLGVLDQRLYTIIVTMALLTTLAMPTMLRWAFSRLPCSTEEQERLRREAFEQRSFVAGIERILVAADDSASGLLASRLAGLVAGSRGIPTTVLHIDAQAQGAAVASAPDEAARSAAETGRDRSVDAEPPIPAPITLRIENVPLQDAVAKEAKKDYGILAIGVRDALAGGRFAGRIGASIGGFNGPLALVVARGDLEKPMARRLRLLVPVSGNEASRQALEFALSIARSTDSDITALYVANERRRVSSRLVRLARLGVAGNEQMVLHDATALADEYNVRLKTAISSGPTPEEGILRYDARERHDVIVMGVTRRSQQELFFGEVAEAVLAGAAASIVLLAQPSA